VRKNELLWGSLGEGGLILAVAAIAWVVKQPLIFASLGPTAYELIEQPQLRSARTYNVIVGHLLGVACGFLALYLLRAWSEPNVLSTGIVSPGRLWAVTIAASLTVFSTLIARAAQPAALATTLLIALGAMQTLRDAIAIAIGVVIVTALGQPLRHLRLRSRVPVGLQALGS
jgi:hypothetical protein